MARQAKKVIEAQKKGESATIIVGNIHVKSIFNQLSEDFPEHSIVACFSNKHLVTLSRNGRVELVKGIEAKRVKPEQEMKDIKTEL
jgi:hypothetical protein